MQYEIRVNGHLGTRWAAWFDGLAITSESDGTSVLRGSVVDQAALHGLLQKLREPLVVAAAHVLHPARNITAPADATAS